MKYRTASVVLFFAIGGALMLLMEPGSPAFAWAIVAVLFVLTGLEGLHEWRRGRRAQRE